MEGRRGHSLKRMLISSHHTLDAARSAVFPISKRVYFVRGPLSNWVILTDGLTVGLIDCGYPSDLPSVRASVKVACGYDLPVKDVYLTHAHTDHMGTAQRLVDEDGAQVHCAEVEVHAVRRQEIRQVGVRDVLAQPRPKVLAWAYRAIRAGGISDVAVPGVLPLPDTPIFVAGLRVVPLSYPGHTLGHTAFWLPGAETIVTGDALVTNHPTSRRVGPQSLHSMFHHDPHRAHESMHAIAQFPAWTLLPGHGPVAHIRTPAWDGSKCSHLGCDG